jgi:hypothetical protein
VRSEARFGLDSRIENVASAVEIAWRRWPDSRSCRAIRVSYDSVRGDFRPTFMENHIACDLLRYPVVCGKPRRRQPPPDSFSFDPPYPNIQIDQQPDFIFLDLNRVTRVIEDNVYNIGGASRLYPPETLLF